MEKLNIKFKSIFRHSVIKNSLIMFIGSIFSNILAYLYHLLIGRILGPVNYGELGALLSIFYILNVPSGVIQTGLTKYFSVLKARNSNGQSRSLFIKTIFIISLIGSVGLIIVFVLMGPIAVFLKIKDPILLMLLYLLFVTYFVFVPSSCALSGYQKFKELTIITNLSSVFRLILGIIGAFFGVAWTLVANVFSNILSIVVSIFPMKFILSVKSEKLVISKKKIAAYSIPMTITLLGLTSIYSTDIVLVKHFFSSFDAGIYTSLSVLGKIIFFASSAITSVMFPTIAERKEKGENYKQLILTGAGVVFLISLFFTLIYFIFPELTVRTLFGNSYDSAIQYIGRFGIFLSFVTLATFLVQSMLAAGKIKVSIFVTIASLSQIALIWFNHQSISDVISINTFISLGLCIILSIYTFI